MNINKSEVLSQGLSLLTYNGGNIVVPKDNPNVFVGLGLWSVKDKLSQALPIDVMWILVSAAILRLQIEEANLGTSSRVIILIADSMAIREGAEKKQVCQLVQLYKKSLEPLLDLLHIKGHSEMMLSSELESCGQYMEILESIENSRIVKQLKEEDETHYAYVRTQTAITRYMNMHRQVGIKVGWIRKESSKQLQGRLSAQSLHWDELEFDRRHDEICEGSTMQYLYTKAGLKQSDTNVSEGCPYTAYAKDKRYIVQTQGKKDIKTIQKRVAAHWKGVAEVCSNLINAGLVRTTLLPKDCIKKSNLRGTVYNMLNHWANPPEPSKAIVCDSPVSILSSDFLSNCTYHPTLEDSYKSLRMAEGTDMIALDKLKSSQRGVTL